MKYDTIYSVEIIKKKVSTGMPKPPNPYEAGDIAYDLRDAIYKLGTNDELFEKSVFRINEGNILDINRLWNETISPELFGGETLIESILSDADSTQRKTLGKHILDTLCEKAKMEGVEDADMLKRDTSDKFEEETSKLFVSNKRLAKIFNELFDTVQMKHEQNEQNRPKNPSFIIYKKASE